MLPSAHKLFCWFLARKSMYTNLAEMEAFRVAKNWTITASQFFVEKVLYRSAENRSRRVLEPQSSTRHKPSWHRKKGLLFQCSSAKVWLRFFDWRVFSNGRHYRPLRVLKTNWFRNIIDTVEDFFWFMETKIFSGQANEICQNITYSLITMLSLVGRRHRFAVNYI